jgi:hypothetical protein
LGAEHVLLRRWQVQRPGALAAISLDIHILRGVLGALRSLARIGQDIRLVADELGNGLYGDTPPSTHTQIVYHPSEEVEMKMC